MPFGWHGVSGDPDWLCRGMGDVKVFLIRKITCLDLRFNNQDRCEGETRDGETLNRSPVIRTLL